MIIAENNNDLSRLKTNLLGKPPQEKHGCPKKQAHGYLGGKLENKTD